MRGKSSLNGGSRGDFSYHATPVWLSGQTTGQNDIPEEQCQNRQISGCFGVGIWGRRDGPPTSTETLGATDAFTILIVVPVFQVHAY